ncbi:MAG: hypothetical protein FWD69_07255 [Polyangiaceae bacterium]|nr:hypothetical protein [Polyangiaceae bacterium]
MQTLPPPDPSSVDASLNALDDVMRMLSSLNQHPSSAVAPPRRGRIDLAALLWEIAPGARVSIEPGSGTEIFGDESDLRRTLQVMIGHAGGEGSSATVRRDGDDVRVSVALGPDSSPTAEMERAWLSRMAMRYGGHYELESGTEVLVFPAEGAVARSEREALRRELDEARKQSEIYARELAAVFERGEDAAFLSSIPAPPKTSSHLGTVTKICAGISAELRRAIDDVSRELAAHESDPLGAIRRSIQSLTEAVTSLERIGRLDADELAIEVDLASVVRAAVRDMAATAERARVNVAVHEDGDGRSYVRAGAKAMASLVRGLVANAVASSRADSTIDVHVDNGVARLVVEDSGPPLPASARKNFLSLKSNAGAHGRPSALPVFMAAELAACLGATLELSDAPSGGLRVTVTF